MPEPKAVPVLSRIDIATATAANKKFPIKSKQRQSKEGLVLIGKKRVDYCFQVSPAWLSFKARSLKEIQEILQIMVFLSTNGY